MKPFGVVFTYSFDPTVDVYLFDTEEKAIDYLMKSLHEEMRVQLEENGWDSEYELSEDRWEATITTHSTFGDDVMKIRVAYVHEGK